jgi:hypothetical protein
MSAAFGTGNPMVAPKVFGLAFDAALFVGSAGVQNSASNRQCERNATNRAVSSRRYPRNHPFAGQISISFVPIHLSIHSPRVALRHAGFAHLHSQRDFAIVHILANGSFTDLAIRQVVPESVPRYDGTMCRCLRGALRSASGTASTNSTAAFNFERGRSVFFRGVGIGFPIASRNIRRCTPSFWATPTIVPTPNSYASECHLTPGAKLSLAPRRRPARRAKHSQAEKCIEARTRLLEGRVDRTCFLESSA